MISKLFLAALLLIGLVRHVEASQQRQRMSNAERLKRGLPVNNPKRLFRLYFHLLNTQSNLADQVNSALQPRGSGAPPVPVSAFVKVLPYVAPGGTSKRARYLWYDNQVGLLSSVGHSIYSPLLHRLTGV